MVTSHFLSVLVVFFWGTLMVVTKNHPHVVVTSTNTTTYGGDRRFWLIFLSYFQSFTLLGLALRGHFGLWHTVPVIEAVLQADRFLVLLSKVVE